MLFPRFKIDKKSLETNTLQLSPTNKLENFKEYRWNIKSLKNTGVKLKNTGEISKH